MKLDRNVKGSNKYGVVRMRRVAELPANDRARAEGCICVLEQLGVFSRGPTGSDDEFFVIMLKDRHAQSALLGYATHAATSGDVELSQDVAAVAERSGPGHPNCKDPD
jgi:hypothetical protein